MNDYSLEQCNERIAHWEKELEDLSTKNIKPESKMFNDKICRSLLAFWIGYKDKHYSV